MRKNFIENVHPVTIFSLPSGNPDSSSKWLLMCRNGGLSHEPRLTLEPSGLTPCSQAHPRALWTIPMSPAFPSGITLTRPGLPALPSSSLSSPLSPDYSHEPRLTLEPSGLSPGSPLSPHSPSGLTPMSPGSTSSPLDSPPAPSSSPWQNNTGTDCGADCCRRAGYNNMPKRQTAS